MAAYNDVNGVAATEQDELNNGVLKGEWGWDGVLMSDWGATKTTAPGGQRRPRPGHARTGGPWGDRAGPAVEAGEVDEVTIDEHLARLLRLAGRVGALDGIPAGRGARQLDAARRTGRSGGPGRPAHLAAAAWCCSRARRCCRWRGSAITAEAPVVLVGGTG